MIRYVTGDATRPEGNRARVICHVCNDRGAWGVGFVVALSRRWKAPERDYRAQSRRVLGETQFVVVETNVVVANMIAQHDFPTIAKRVALDYWALEACLVEVGSHCVAHGASLHMPRIGCGTAGGDWDQVALLIDKSVPASVPVTVYDLHQGQRV
jgi:O-acetyl-ADP-ribose deacetylase (regulator of RNase III)